MLFRSESGPPNWANVQWYDAMEAFTAGQAGMIADADFFAQNYEDPAKSKVAGKVAYALLPTGPEGKAYAGLGLVMEYVAHRVKQAAARECAVPVELTALAVGPSPAPRP